MSDWKLKTPVAFIIFKRPDTTEKVFEAIRQAKPRKLFVIADGSRVDRPGEAERCAAARAIIDRVDYANLSTDCIEFPLKHPPFMVRDRKADEFTQDTLFQTNWLQRFKAQIKNRL